MKYKKLSVLAAALAVAMALSGCGGSSETAPAETASPAPTAETTIMPTTTPGSVNEKDENTGDMTNPDNSVDAGDGSTSESRQENKGYPAVRNFICPIADISAPGGKVVFCHHYFPASAVYN